VKSLEKIKKIKEKRKKKRTDTFRKQIQIDCALAEIKRKQNEKLYITS